MQVGGVRHAFDPDGLSKSDWQAFYPTQKLFRGLIEFLDSRRTLDFHKWGKIRLS